MLSSVKLLETAKWWCSNSIISFLFINFLKLFLFNLLAKTHAYGILAPNQGLNLCTLALVVQSLNYQSPGSPSFYFSNLVASLLDPVLVLIFLWVSNRRCILCSFQYIVSYSSLSGRIFLELCFCYLFSALPWILFLRDSAVSRMFESFAYFHICHFFSNIF